MTELPNEIVGDVILYLTPWKIGKLNKINPFFKELKDYINFNPEFPYKYKGIKVYKKNRKKDYILSINFKFLKLGKKSLRNNPHINYYSYKDVKWKNYSFNDNLSYYGYHYIIDKLGIDELDNKYQRDFIIRNLDVKKAGKDITPLRIKIVGNDRILFNWVTNREKCDGRGYNKDGYNKEKYNKGVYNDHLFIYKCAPFTSFTIEVTEINGEKCKVEELLFSFDIGFSSVEFFDNLSDHPFYYENDNYFIYNYSGCVGIFKGENYGKECNEKDKECDEKNKENENRVDIYDFVPRRNNIDNFYIHRDTVKIEAKRLEIQGNITDEIFDTFPYHHPEYEICRMCLFTNPPIGTLTIKSTDFNRAIMWINSMSNIWLISTSTITKYLPLKRVDIDKTKEIINRKIDRYITLKEIFRE